MEVDFLLHLAIILICTKVLGLISRKVHMPQVVGALLAGIMLGPMCLSVLHETDFIVELAELGVVLLMFNAGMETDIKQLREASKAAFVIASIGVIVPLAGGFILAGFYGQDVLKSIFIGVILTATSVTITVETLQEMGRLKSRAGTAILAAAVIDDIIGIVILSVIIGVGDSSSVAASAIFLTLLKIVLFFIFTAVTGFFVFKGFELINKLGKKRRLSIFAFAYCLLLAYSAELFGVADITGAYFAGLILCNNGAAKYIEEKTETISYLLLSPIFFASIGLKTAAFTLNPQIVTFTALFFTIAVLSKIVGCGFGALLCKYDKKEALQIGIGMVSRGEVALIVANRGLSTNLLDPALFSGILVVVIATTLITPIMLKKVYS